MATNPYFNNFNSAADQGLIEDLFIEAIKMYGQDMYYIPRTLVREDTLMGDDTYSEFNDARLIEIYIKDVDGFSGEVDVISRFGLEIHDEITFTDVWSDMFLKRYNTALMKKQWGQNLIKFEGLQLPGGVTMNGRQMYDDAKEELDVIGEQMQLRYELPVDHLIG